MPVTMANARVYMGLNDMFTAMTPGTTLYGSTGYDTVILSVGAARISINQTVDKIVLPGVVSSYAFRQMGNQVGIYNAAGTDLVTVIAVQDDDDGTMLMFSDGTASVQTHPGGGMTLGGETVNNAKITSLVPTLRASVPVLGGITQSKVYLDLSDSFGICNDGATVYGNAGDETVWITAGTANISLSQTVEKVSLPGDLSTYTFLQTGNQLSVYDSAGRVRLLSIPIQDDADGTVLTFADQTLSASLQAGGVLKLGSSVVSINAPAKILSQGVWAALSLQAGGFSHSATGIGVLSTDSAILAPLVSGEKWSSSTLMFSFNTSAPEEYSEISSSSTPTGSLTAGWSMLDSAEKASVTRAVTALQAIIPIKITEVAGNAGDIRFNVLPMTGGTSGFAYYPGIGIGGDVFLSSGNRKQFDYLPGDQANMTVLHELGHAMGLKHPFEAPNVLNTAKDNNAQTVMSYTPGKTMLMNFTPSGVSYSYSAEPSAYEMLDIAALQSLYGANTATCTGNDIYTMKFADHPMCTIWDAGGTDTIDASTATGPCSVDLRAGRYSSMDVRDIATQCASTIAYYHSLGRYNYDSWVNGIYADSRNTKDLYTGENNLGIGYGVWIENVSTGNANDTVRDNEIDNKISTGAGDDLIQLFDGGYDTVDGGAGFDTVQVNDAKVRLHTEKQVDGSYLIVGSYFAARLVGIEKVLCVDGEFTL